MAYLVIRQNEWSLVRGMYAAILRAIEVQEYSWEDNFDRFENMVAQQTIRMELDKLTKERKKAEIVKRPPSQKQKPYAVEISAQQRVACTTRTTRYK